MSGPVFILDPDTLRDRIARVVVDESNCSGHLGVTCPHCSVCTADAVLAVLAEVGAPAFEERFATSRRWATSWEATS